MPLRPRLKPWMLVSAVWIAPAVLATLDRLAQRRLSGAPPATVPELLWAGGDWLVYAILVPPVFAVSRRWPIARPHIARRALLHPAFALVFCAAWATSGKALQLGLSLIFTPHDIDAMATASNGHLWQRLASDWLSWVFTTLPFGVVVYLSITGIAHALRYFTEASERDVQLARLSEQLAGARLSALQAQLNPHFLFNTLNTIAVRARDGDGAGTARMVEQLSDILRRTLGRHRSNVVTLGEELALVRQYLAIEQARFSDRLRPDLQIDDGILSAAVPGFALQHLVENAIRHGVARRADAGHVTVVARRDRDRLILSVTDDGAGIEEDASMTAGHGLDSARERLRSLYGSRASLIVVRAAPVGTVATLTLPYTELEAGDGAH